MVIRLNSNAVEFDGLFQQLGYYNAGDSSWQTPSDWLGEDSMDPGYQLLTVKSWRREVLNLKKKRNLTSMKMKAKFHTHKPSKHLT